MEKEIVKTNENSPLKENEIGKDPLGLFAWPDGNKDFSQCHLGLDLLNGGELKLTKEESNLPIQ